MSMVEISPQEAVAKSGFLDRMPNDKMPKRPPTGVKRIVFWMVLFGFGLFGGLLVWASTVEMTSAVVSNGSFKVVGDRLVVQHFEGGIVSEIAVKEGDVVEQGDVLIRLDGTRPRAQISILQNQLASALAQQARLRAELVEASEVPMPDELAMLVKHDPRLKELFSAQQAVYQSNNNMEQGQLGILQSRISQLEQQMNGLDARRASYIRQLEIVQEERADLESLFEQGLVPKTRLSNRMQAESSLIGDLAGVESRIENTMERMGEMQERILQVRRDRVRRNSDETQDVQEMIFDLRQRIHAFEDVLNRLVITAPRSGRIVNLKVNTVGGVIEGGDPLLEIVPEDGGLVLETRISPSDIDEVEHGGTATVRLTAYSFRSTPPVTGEVTMVAADSNVDAATGRPYYRVDITVPQEEINALANVRALPGMPAQAMIETGRQTLMDYLLNPILSPMSTAMKESES